MYGSQPAFLSSWITDIASSAGAPLTSSFKHLSNCLSSSGDGISAVFAATLSAASSFADGLRTWWAAPRDRMRPVQSARCLSHWIRDN